VVVVGNGPLAAQLVALCEQAGFATQFLPDPMADCGTAIAQADWIIEASGGSAAAKQRILARIEVRRTDDSLVTSDESVVPRAELSNGLGDRFERSFAITHFFSPVDRLQLMELVLPASMAPGLAEQLRAACTGPLSRTVIECSDTPGFLANRIGLFAMAAGIVEAIDGGLAVEEADALASSCLGLPRTGFFGLADLIGLPVVLDLSAELRARLPIGDAWATVDLAGKEPIADMVRQGRLGRAAGGGFYRRVAGTKVDEPLDLRTNDYRPTSAPAVALSIADLHADDSVQARYATKLIRCFGSYAAQIARQTKTSPALVDQAVQLGFGWAEGPLALAARAGLLQAD